MTRVLTEAVLSALRELADLEYQRRVWTGRDRHGAMSSFEECVATLLDDSGLGLGLEARGPVFDARIDAELQSLRLALARIDTQRSPDALVADPEMSRIRDQAAAVLRELTGTEGVDESGSK